MELADGTVVLRVAVRVSGRERENAIATLLELAPEGFDEAERGDEVEFGVYTDAAGEARLRAAFGSTQSRPVAPGWEDALARLPSSSSRGRALDRPAVAEAAGWPSGQS